MKKTQLKQLIKEEILNLLNEENRPITNKLGLDFKAKKLARKVKSILDRIEQDPKYIESKRLFDSGKMGKRKFEDIIRKELLTPEEHKIFDTIVADSGYQNITSTNLNFPMDPDFPADYNVISAPGKVGQSNVMKRAIDMGLNPYGFAFGSSIERNTTDFDSFKY